MPRSDIRTDDLLLRMEQFRAPHQLQFQGQTSHALKAFARLHPLLALQTPSRSQAQSVSRRQATLLEIDNTLLTRLHNAGYLPVSPVVLDLGYSPSTSPGSQATIAHGVPGRVYMETQGDGDIENMPLVQPGGEGEDSIRSLHRWMVLLHEAAHCQFEHDGVRFAPTPGLISKLEENALSKWAFSLCGRDGYAKRLLHENYADTYASMMLLQATGHTPEAVEIVKRHTSMRYEKSVDAAKMWIEYQDEVPIIPHLTHHALGEVLDSVNTWKYLSPEEIRARAVEIASNGVLKTARHDGKPSLGLSLGQHIKNRIANIQPSLDQLFGARFAAMLMDVDNHDQVRYSIQSEALADLYDQNIQSLMEFGMSKQRSTFNSLAGKILPSQWKARLNNLSKHMKPRLERVKSKIDSHAGLAEEIRQDREALKEFLQSGNPEAPPFKSISLLNRVSERREQISQSFPNSRAPRVS